MSGSVTVVDYDCGNLFSVVRAFEHCGGTVELATEPDQVARAERLVLPGVGAFGAAMKTLRDRGLADAVKEFAATGRPFLGICVGLQVMMDYSEEFGRHEGLGLIPGAVLAIPPTTKDGTPHPIPHIGWAKLEPASPDNNSTIFGNLDEDCWAYFVHSFGAVPEDPAHVVVTCDYNGQTITAAAAKDNMIGCQFHPEKSGPDGLKMIDNFLSL